MSLLDVSRDDSQKLLWRHWASEQAPWINGIIHGQGLVEPMVVEVDRGDATSTEDLVVKRSEPLHLQDLSGSDQLHWVEITPTVQVSVRDLTAHAGEGAMGADGFVALTKGQELLWLAFFDHSNPFAEVDFFGDSIIAKSTYWQQWTFPITNPGAVTVEQMSAPWLA